ncbi:unnamed protein product [Thelazia callipaeda]|uniref:DUF3421 domain-containing protein n=1 Tax=Thelazia callipaeda TaxID=103827 RepID=A0A0N5CUB0_THECL|nr:unnamed protein product [Thelazia callipaeda]
MRMPKEAVRPFERSLRFDNLTIDVAVAFWIPGNGAFGIWGRAWEEKGRIKGLFIAGNTVKVLSQGFRLLIYKGSSSANGFRFAWIRVKDVDHGTVVFSGPNSHVAAVFADKEKNNEFLGDANWPKKRMEYVNYGMNETHTVGNYGGKRYFDEDVYVLTKQRCNCSC